MSSTNDLKYKFQLYNRLQQNIPNIYAEARMVADKIKIPKEIRGKIGLTGAISGCPAPMRKNISEAVHAASREVIPLVGFVDQIREIVKDVYGDEYDAAPICTCEAALWLCFDVLATPGMQGRGENYRARYIAPYERHLHHQGSYGRPFPSKYKDIFADRGVTAGELGFYGKRQTNLDTVIVPMEGARYEVHGIKHHPVPLLTRVDPQASIKKIAGVAERHADVLTAFTSLGYDSPGYGYGVKDENGTPVLQKMLGELSRKYDAAYICDNAWGLPFAGTDLRKNSADVITYSMDKASGAPTSGLIIGKEDVMVPIRRALGFHGERSGTTSSYGKAAYVTFDPGKEALAGQIAALKTLRDEPEVLTRPVDELYEIVKEEFAALPFERDCIISKSYNSTFVEVNYENTWKDGTIGVPIFNIEDMYAGSNIFQSGVKQMGVIPTIAYDANICISAGQGTTDENGQLIEDRMRYAIKALTALIEIVLKYWKA